MMMTTDATSDAIAGPKLKDWAGRVAFYDQWTTRATCAMTSTRSAATFFRSTAVSAQARARVRRVGRGASYSAR